MLVRRIARPMLAGLFIVMGIDVLRKPGGRAEVAAPLVAQAKAVLPDRAGAFVPSDPENTVRLNALVQIGGGLMLATGKYPRIASSVLAATLVPTTVAGHPFWAESDPERRHAQQTQFLKNISILGGLLLAAVDTEGKPSLSWRGRRAAQEATAALSAALPSHALALPTHAPTLPTHAAVDSFAHSLGQSAQAAGERAGAIADRIAAEAPELRRRARKNAERARKNADRAAKMARAKAEELRQSLA